MRTTSTVELGETVNPRCPLFDPRKHNSYKKVMKLVEEGKVPPARVSEVDIYHDDWCRIYRGGYCNCDPEVRLRPPPEQN